MTRSVGLARLRREFDELHPRLKALLAAGLVLAFLLLAWQQTVEWYRGRLLTEQRSETADELSLRANVLSAGINRRLARLQGLWAFVQTQPRAALDDSFPQFASRLYAGTSAIRNFSIVIGTTVQYVYPHAGNEMVLGYAPVVDRRPEVRANVQRAIATGDMVLSGPMELLQGGLGLVASEAVYNDDGSFWGLTGMVLDIPTILSEAGLTAEEANGLEYALREGNGRVFYGDETVFSRAPVTRAVNFPEGDWTLAGVPRGGWDAAIAPSLRIFAMGGLLIALLLTGVTYLVVSRQATLSLAVQERTHALAQSSLLLEQRVDERTRELATLLEITRNVASTLELQPLLLQIAQQLRNVIDYDAVVIVHRTTPDTLRLLAYQGPLPDSALPDTWSIAPLPEDGEGVTALVEAALASPALVAFGREIVLSGEPLIVANPRDDSAAARLFRWQMERLLGYVPAHVCSWMGVPLIYRENVIGLIGFANGRSGFYTPRHAELALAFANQAAVAIENARLYAQAQTLASLQERQKLARELHDSVSQALYGIALGARTARKLVERSPDESALKQVLDEPLDYVLALAGAGLAEMRALIFELRPESLEAEGLAVALQKQADALRARHQIDVQTHFSCEPRLDLPVKEALYRVAQEAFNNVIKHAQATQVVVALECVDGRARLGVTDNGHGFDTHAQFPGHLGLHSMRERVERVGGSFEIASAPGRGTAVSAIVPLP